MNEGLSGSDCDWVVVGGEEVVFEELFVWFFESVADSVDKGALGFTEALQECDGGATVVGGESALEVESFLEGLSYSEGDEFACFGVFVGVGMDEVCSDLAGDSNLVGSGSCRDP